MMKNMKNAGKMIAATFLMILVFTITASAAAINRTAATLYQDAGMQLTVSGASKVTWTTSNKAVATVTAKGVVKAVKGGNATITAKAGTRRYTCRVTVKNLAMNKATATLKAGASTQLSVAGASKVTWGTSNKAVATVTAKGVVKGIKAGRATITAKAGSRSFTCRVTVSAATNKTTAAANTAAKKTTLTASAVYSKLIAMKASYPEGKKWTNSNYYAWKGGIYGGGYGCAAFAFLMSDAAFGTNKSTMHTNFNNIKVGDILRVDNNTHSVIVLKVTSTYVEVAEGNFNSSIHWGRKITINELKKTGTHVITRY